jgi:hypothetical protein
MVTGMLCVDALGELSFTSSPVRQSRVNDGLCFAGVIWLNAKSDVGETVNSPI